MAQPREWSERQLKALAAMGVPVLRPRRSAGAAQPAPGGPEGWSAAELNGKLATALARVLGVADDALWTVLAQAGVPVPAAAELRASVEAKRQLWRQLRTWLARRAQ